MAILRSVVAASTLVVGAAGYSQTTSAQDQLALASYRGTMLYAYDQAAWHGSDDFQRRGRNLMTKACGRVVTGPADATDLAFVDCAQKSALYRARFNMGKLISASVVEGSAAARLTELERQTLAAGERGLEALVRPRRPFARTRSQTSPFYRRRYQADLRSFIC